MVAVFPFWEVRAPSAPSLHQFPPSIPEELSRVSFAFFCLFFWSIEIEQ